VTDAAAKPLLWQGRRLQASRLVQYVLLQAAIAAACILMLRQPLPEPPSRYLVTEFSLNERGTVQSVTLPHFVASRYAMDDPPLYTSRFTWPGSEASRAWSVFLPRFTNGVEVTVNGVVILDSRRDPAANRPDRNTPEIAVIPSSLLRNGQNDLAIRLFVWGPITGFLDRIYVGPDESLRPSYDQRMLLFVTLPVVFSAWEAILAASAPLESACVLSFAMLFFGLKWPRWGFLIFVPALVLLVGGLFGNRIVVRDLFLFVGVPTIGLYLVLLAPLAAWSVLRRQDVASFLLGCAVTIVLTCWTFDILSVLQLIPSRRIFVARLSYSAMLVAIGAALTWRFARALNQVDGFAGRMVVLVRETEEKLKASFARAALKDLRLVIDAMDDIGGDLMLALGSWRERAMAQLRPHGIVLDWHTLSPQGLPVHPELRPWHVIQIVRLLDEALTNAVKHAEAQRITVSIETLADATGEPRGCITVEDDGKGFALAADAAAAVSSQKAARGLRNMRSRAARCGAELELFSGARGTRMRLTLLQRFPDSDSAAG